MASASLISSQNLKQNINKMSISIIIGKIIKDNVFVDKSWSNGML